VHLHGTVWLGLGWLLLVGGLAVFLGMIAAALLRIRSQYSRGMSGLQGMRLTAAIIAAIRASPALVAAVAGLLLLYALR
jgi:hypothetical protein